MSRRRFGQARALLDDLLDRYEANPGAARLFAYLDLGGFESISDYDACLAELGMVERAGGIVVRRRHAAGADQIESVRLADAAAVYRHMTRTPSGDRADRALAHLELSTADAGLIEVLKIVRTAWARNVRAFGLAPHDGEALAVTVALAQALAARLGDADTIPMDFRTFSRVVAGDSKALDRLASSVAQLVRHLRSPAVAPEMETTDEVIGAFGVTRLPQPLLISAPLTLDGVPLSYLPFVGVPPECANRIGFARAPAYVLIVENYTSFVRHAREVNADLNGAVIFSSGFPARPILDGIVRLVGETRAPTYHWGDIDLGGLRIFLHLERALAAVGQHLLPHLMSAALLESHGTASSRRGWIRSVQVPARSALEQLCRQIGDAQLDLELEQEAVAPAVPPYSS